MAALLAAGLVLGPVLGVVAAVSVTYVQVDRNGPPKAWGKGAGDLNGDGKADLVVGSVVGGLFWYSNPGWTKRVISAGIRTQEDLEVIDLDKDGRRDVVAATANAVTWFENNGGGTSWTGHTLVSGRDLHDLEVVDLDGDGKLDLVGRDQYAQGETLFLWRQISLTNWAPSTIPNVETGTGLTAVDLNRDGKIDLATNKYWFRNTSTNGDFSFEKILYNTNAEKDAYVTAGRVDGDANVDLVVTPAHPTIGGTHNVAWYRNPGSGNGTWTRRVVESGVQSVVHFAAVADFDGDGRNDITTAMTHRGTNPKIKIYYNEDGSGSFSAPDIVANASSHMMQIVNVAGKTSLFGADYDEAGSTSIDLWQIGSAPANPVLLGCFKDEGTIGATNGRDLNGFLLADRTSMTPALCNRTCGNRGYRFAGTQAGYQCFCGNRYGTFGGASNCTTSCTGDTSKKCGGSWANSVFDLR